MSIMSVAVLWIYIATVVACFGAAIHGRLSKAPGFNAWTAISMALIVLGAFRLFNGEDFVRNFLRESVRRAGHYDDRTPFQMAALVIAIVLAVALIWLAWRYWPRARSGRMNQAVAVARLSLLAFLPLYSVRIISLHATDALLYAGPIRLNWVLELGLLVTILAAAVTYQRTARRWKNS